MIAEGEEIARLLVGSSSDGILAFDTDCRYTLWNPTMERISGMRADQVVGRIAFEVFPFLVDIGEDHHFREALAGRTSLADEREFTIPETGRRGYFEGQYSPLHREGRVIGGVAIIRDITERKLDTTARFEFLARAGEALASSLDYETTLKQVAQLALPVLGDICIVDMLEDQQLRRVATAHVEPGKVALLDELRRLYPPARGAPSPAGRVMTSGKPEVAWTVSPEVIASHTSDAQHADLIRRIGYRSHIAVPLVARGSTLGVLSLGMADSGRVYTPADVSLAVDLARRVAQAIDNALLYEASQRELVERRRSESRFIATTQQSPLSIQILAKDGTIAFVNKSWERMWGLTVDMIPGYNLLQDPQLEASGMLAMLRRAFDGELVELPVHRYDPNASVEVRSTNEDPVRYLRTFAYPIKSPAGEVLEVALIQEDVTLRRRAEEQLRASEERLRIAMLGAQMNVWEWNLANDHIEASENSQEFWGIRVGALTDFLRVIHPADREAVRRARDKAASGAPYEVEYRIVRDNETRWLNSRGQLVKRPDGEYILGVSVDITQRKLAENETRILADAGESLGASLDLRVTLANLCRVVVPRLADWCTIDLVDESGVLDRVAAFHPDPKRVAAVMQLFQTDPPSRDAPHGPWRVIQTGEPDLVVDVSQLALDPTRDQKRITLVEEIGLRSFICVPLVTRGKTIGTLTMSYAESGRRFRAEDLALATDIARRAASAVENAHLYTRLREEDRRKDEFLATLAHELRNPLAPLSSGLELLKKAGDPRLETTRVVMDRQLTHLVRLVDDLLDVSRVTRGKIVLRREPLDVASLVATALEVSRAAIDKAGLELTVSLPDEPLSFEGDRTRIAQVLTNLMTNAAKYNVPGGKIAVSAYRDGHEVVFEVADTGVGIPREMHSQIFEMFVQVHRKYEQPQGGLGIGLTLVRRLVELHGGRVWVESNGDGQGSKFVVRLPNVVEAAAAPSPAAFTSKPRAPRRILVVDDNEDAVFTLSALLELDGHEVRTATSGPDALEVLRSFKPDVALLDIGLPGMSGYELARHMRDLPQLAPLTLVALTGWGQEDDRRQSHEAGFHHHFTKPVDLRKLQSLFE